MPESGAVSRLLELPWDIRRIILDEILQHGQDNLPRFNQELLESRVRLRNCFDDKLPKETNFYVPKHKYSHLPSNVLQATNRQLRDETRRLVEQQDKSSQTDVPFTLDVMIVKDIGVFPTWTSFPYTPKHLKLLTVNIRIIRPGTSKVPNEWVEVARREKSGLHPTPIIWNTLMAVIFYALGLFSVTPDASQALAQSATTKGVPVEMQNDNEIKRTQLPLRPQEKLLRCSKLLDPVDYRGDVFDAYRLPSALYVTDKLYIHFDEPEYTVDNVPIPPGLKDNYKDSPFYQEGYEHFERDILQNDDSRKDADNLEEARSFIARGLYASYQLQTQLTEILVGASGPKVFTSPYALFLQTMARSVGTVWHSGCKTPMDPLMYRHPSDWTYGDVNWEGDEQEGESQYHEEIIERNLARELAREPLDEEHIVKLRTLQARRAHGWIRDSD